MHRAPIRSTWAASATTNRTRARSISGSWPTTSARARRSMPCRSRSWSSASADREFRRVTLSCALPPLLAGARVRWSLRGVTGMDLRMNRLRVALALALIAVAGPAAALGLGQIQVKSKVDQPLLAEIPIISSDPSELEQLQARLASPDTFRRIGLDPPTGAAADLDFSVALDERGRPVIRVTSSAPVDQPLVTFLVEVDWGSGRLVREYSALLDTPRTVAAPAQPPIQAPTMAPSNVIERPVAAAPEPAPAPTEDTTPPPPAEAAPPEPAPANDVAVAPTPT